MDKIYSRLILCALLISIILNVFLSLYDVQDFPFSINLSNFAVIAGKLISHFALALAAGTMIYLGINKYSVKKFFTYSTSVGLVGCLICAYNVAMPLLNLKLVTDLESLLIQISNSDKSPQLNEIMDNKNLSLKMKSTLSSSLARKKYEDTGRFTEYMNEQGKVLLYIPSNTEIEQREDEIRAHYNLYLTKTNIYYQIVFWFSVLLLSVGFSLLYRRKR